MRKIGVVTTSRADYGIYRPLLKSIQADEALELSLIVTGMHLSPHYGQTVKLIEADGFEVSHRVEMLLSSDTAEAVVKSMGLGVIGFGQLFATSRPDLLVVLGDRFEMYSAALAALPFKIPVAHIHGGELTRGAIDDALRHSITKLSHLHFVSTMPYARRVIQLGEEPWRVTVSGAPALDNLDHLTLLTADELKVRYHLPFDQPPLLVTFHPVTLESERVQEQIAELLAALDVVGLPVVFTAPNADTHNDIIFKQIAAFVDSHPTAEIVPNFGPEGYFSMLAIAAAMVGNSSSGLIEAASFKLPVVNIGIRQWGRVRAQNVIDVGHSCAEIVAGIRQAISPGMRERLLNLTNPYRQDEPASAVIVRRLKEVPLDNRLIVKAFYDLEGSASGETL